MSEQKTYKVTCEGRVTETYIVTASSEAEAMTNWFDGEIFLSEAWDVEPVRVVLDG